MIATPATQPKNLPIGSRKHAAWERALAHPSPQRPAATLVVSNCDDSGAGSLRDTVAAAADLDTVDLTQLTCSTISLTTGAITVSVNDLTLVGPGANSLYIDAGHFSHGYNQSDFYHLGTGYLNIQGIRIGGGSYTGYYAPDGGCIYSTGSVKLVNSTVAYCYLNPPPGTTPYSRGGAIFAAQGVYLEHSSVSFGSAYSPSSVAAGGGIFSSAGFVAKYSIVSNNEALAAEYTAFGGGVAEVGSITLIENSSIVDNYSAHNVGGIEILAFAGGTATIGDSTISNNVAVHVDGGILTQVPLELGASTIAFNTEGNTGNYNYIVAAGLDVYDTTMDVQSTIIADNTYVGNLSDISGYLPSITGANNLTRYVLTSMPGDTIYADPLLSSLAFNGGPTPTNALQPGSPALERGNNSFMLRYDQRGPGYLRVIGSNADIGAYEFNSNDDIFANGFD